MDPLFGSVDLGGTNTVCALATAAGEVAAECALPTEPYQGPAAVLDRIAAALEALARQTGAAPAAIGMGMPGLVDRARGVTLFLPNLPTQWRGVDAAARISSRLSCPVYLLNDVRAATLGELVYGRGRGAATMLFFAIGTGVGGGVVVDGRLRLGPLGAAGEMGHQTIVPDGRRCGCGSRGCLETLASGPAITAEGVWLMLAGRAPRLYEICAGNPAAVTPRRIAEAALAGDDAVREAIDRIAVYLSIAISNVVQALHPDLVVIGGGVSGMGPALLEPVRRDLHSRIGIFPADNLPIETSALGDRAGLYGGVALAARAGKLE
jgi:glucokinase